MYKSNVLTDLQVHLAVGDKGARSFLQFVDKVCPGIINEAYPDVAVFALDSLFSVWKVAPEQVERDSILDTFYKERHSRRFTPLIVNRE